MHKFVRSLITEWRRLDLPFADETLVLAVSGGADSLSLLLALEDLIKRKKLTLRVVAAHFNHRLRGAASDADEEFVKHIAAERGFELAIGHGRPVSKGNLEQEARNARYEFLTRTAENLNAGRVLTAHTMNDQAETFLLNLIRGSGIDGLSGMRTKRELRDAETRGSGNSENDQITDDKGETDRFAASPLLPFSSTPPLLIRPLLRWAKRADTENFCRASGVEFRYDTMNEDMSFKRVRVRKMLLPMLAEFNPKIIETLASTANLMSEPRAAATRFPSSAKPPDTLSVRELMLLSPNDLNQTLRSWLKARRGSLRAISLKHIEAIEQLIKSQKSGRIVELPGNGLVRKHGGRLSFDNIKVDK